MNYENKIAAQLNVRPQQIAATIQLIDSGNTIPFISRYRKEATGNLDEEQIRKTSDLLEKYRALDDRRSTIVSSIEEQGKMTPDLMDKITVAETMTTLEDLYQPYKPKKRTRASIAREKGLQGLADLILQQPLVKQKLEEIASTYINESIESVDNALSGARDIVAEAISDHADVRSRVREKAMQWGGLKSVKIDDAKDERKVYEMYYEFEMRADRLRPHHVLAINRGETEKVLRVTIEIAERDWQDVILNCFKPDRRSIFYEQLNLAISDSAERLLLPSIERDVRRALTEKSELHAIGVFSENLKALLNQPPLNGFVVMGLDPGFRTGCKVAVVDWTGKVLDTGTIYPHEPQKHKSDALDILKKFISKHHVTLITIGNGTASRETEQLVAELISDVKNVKYLIVSEAGASVYSASPLARSELPDLDVSIRGAVSIARRIQDPLAELVKIDPKSIGVGMYQHDVTQSDLEQSLNEVVESVVNRVGVDINTASPALLTYVSGIGPKLAEKIVSYRNDNGKFLNREEIIKVPGLGPKAFEQASGFLRIRDGDNPLDSSAIHPESYNAAKQILKSGGIKIQDEIDKKRAAIEEIKKQKSMEKLAIEVGIGKLTLEDIFEQIVRPGRDPRQDLPTPILRSDVLSMEDLITGMRLKGTVRNVVDFGIFVDIGVKQDGLIHRSQLPDGTKLQVGDIIDIEILKVEKERGRISLSYVKGKN